MDYSHKFSSIKAWQYAFEKLWLFYKVWGRLLYQPDASDEIFSSAFDSRYGQGIGENLFPQTPSYTGYRNCQKIYLQAFNSKIEHYENE